MIAWEPPLPWKKEFKYSCPKSNKWKTKTDSMVTKEYTLGMSPKRNNYTTLRNQL